MLIPYLNVDIPIDGVAITLAVYLLSPANDKIRNAIIVAAIHGTLHPWEIKEHVKEACGGEAAGSPDVGQVQVNAQDC